MVLHVPSDYRARMWPKDLLCLLWQRQWYVLEQSRLERQLLVIIAQLRNEWSELELQQWWCQPAEQQQSVQRLRRPPGSAYNSVPPFPIIRL